MHCRPEKASDRIANNAHASDSNWHTREVPISRDTDQISRQSCIIKGNIWNLTLFFNLVSNKGEAHASMIHSNFYHEIVSYLPDVFGQKFKVSKASTELDPSHLTMGNEKESLWSNKWDRKSFLYHEMKIYVCKINLGLGWFDIWTRLPMDFLDSYRFWQLKKFSIFNFYLCKKHQFWTYISPKQSQEEICWIISSTCCI